MKGIVKFNNWSLAITLILYLTIFLGMLAQIILGIFQLASAGIIMIGYYPELSRKFKSLLMIYWILAATCLFLLWYFTYYQYTNDGYLEVSVTIIFPMSIAIYFVILINKISNNHENT